VARKSFKFRLQRLLEIRIMREDIARAELLTRRARVQAEQEKVYALEAQADALRERLVPARGQRVDFDDILLTEYALKLKLQEVSQQESVVAQHEAKVAEQIKVVQQAGIDVKALEKLKEKQLEEHKEEQLREEGLFMDDLAGQQFIRNQKAIERMQAENAAARAALEEEHA
jgi:flagellar export protein FliJ